MLVDDDDTAAFCGGKQRPKDRLTDGQPARMKRVGRRLRFGERVQTAGGEITIAMRRVRDTLTRFVRSVIPDTRAIVRTRPLEALVIGAHSGACSTVTSRALPVRPPWARSAQRP